MKMLFMSIVMVFTGGFAGASAHHLTGINAKTKEAFKKEFPDVASVQWVEVGAYQVAKFGFHNHSMIAFYSLEGDCLGSARQVLYDELPLSVSRLIDQRFEKGILKIAYEVNNDEGLFYWLSVETASKTFQVKASPYGNILTIQKSNHTTNAEKLNQ